mmetsp:Transcript_26332/g.25514  ORF Transcript_26332/g.25514 Transcript_26332/m.25514 type:complete len:131 (+) Transcript_26332:972-1364(+)
MDALEKVFKSFDENGEGVVTKEEFQKGCIDILNLHLSDEEITKIFNDVDINENGTLEYSEFITACKNEEDLLTENKMITAFQMFNLEEKGSITVANIKEVLESFDQHISEEEIEEIMKTVDSDGSGSIDY